MTLAEAQAQVVEWIKAQTARERSRALAAANAADAHQPRGRRSARRALLRDDRATVESNAPFSSIEVRMVPENVTNIPRRRRRIARGDGRERLVQIRHGETFEDVLRANGADRDVDRRDPGRIRRRNTGESPVAEGQKIILRIRRVRRTRRNPRRSPASPSMPTSSSRRRSRSTMRTPMCRSTVARGQAAAARPNAPTRDDDEGGMSLYQSLYETSLKQGLARSRHRRNGARFRQRRRFPALGQTRRFARSPSSRTPTRSIRIPRCCSPSLTVRDQTFRYYRFQTPDDNLVDYYDENGRSTRKFLHPQADRRRAK